MIFQLANNLTHFFVQFCRLVPNGNEYKEWVTQIRHNAVTALFLSLCPAPRVPVNRPVTLVMATDTIIRSFRSSIRLRSCRWRPGSRPTSLPPCIARAYRWGEQQWAGNQWGGTPHRQRIDAIGCGIRFTPTIFMLLTSTLLLLNPPLLAQNTASEQTTTASDPVPWVTGNSFSQLLKTPLSVSWQSAPIRQHLNRLARQQNISILVDRRIDPRVAVDLSVTNVTIEQLLLRLSKQQDLGFCRFGDGYFLGPKHAAEYLLINQQPPKQARRRTALLKKAALAWPDLTTPREALEALVAEANLKTENPQQLPHDLMASVGTSPLTLDQRLKLLLVQFDLHYRMNTRSKTISLLPITPSHVAATVRFPDIELTLQEYQAIKSKVPQCRMKRAKRSITATGTPQNLLRARALIINSYSPALPEVGNQRFTLKVSNRRSVILAAIGQQLQKDIDTARADAQIMEQVITLSVVEVSLQELLSQIVAGTGLTCIIADDKIVLLEE